MVTICWIGLQMAIANRVHRGEGIIIYSIICIIDNIEIILY